MPINLDEDEGDDDEEEEEEYVPSEEQEHRAHSPAVDSVLTGVRMTSGSST